MLSSRNENPHETAGRKNTSGLQAPGLVNRKCFCPQCFRLISVYLVACFLRRLRQSAIMAMNSLFVGFPLILLTV